jgi:hypothetical protein
MWPCAGRDSIENPLLVAREDGSNWLALAALAVARGAKRAILDERVVARAVCKVALILRAFVAVVTLHAFAKICAACASDAILAAVTAPGGWRNAQHQHA